MDTATDSLNTSVFDNERADLQRFDQLETGLYNVTSVLYPFFEPLDSYGAYILLGLVAFVSISVVIVLALILKTRSRRRTPQPQQNSPIVETRIVTESVSNGTLRIDDMVEVSLEDEDDHRPQPRPIPRQMPLKFDMSKVANRRSALNSPDPMNPAVPFSYSNPSYAA